MSLIVVINHKLIDQYISLIFFSLLLFILGLNACVKKPIKELREEIDYSNWMQELIIQHPNQEITLKDIPYLEIRP